MDLADLFASGRIVDLILVAVCIEALLLGALRRTRRRGPVLADWLPNLVAGAALLLALRLALTQSDWYWIAALLLLSLLAHAADLARRLRPRP